MLSKQASWVICSYLLFSSNIKSYILKTVLIATNSEQAIHQVNCNDRLFVVFHSKIIWRVYV